MPAVFSKVAPDGEAPDVEIELDENGQPIYNPVVVYCKHKGKNVLMWQVQEHKLAVDFLKTNLPVSIYGFELIDRWSSNLHLKESNPRHVGLTSWKLSTPKENFHSSLAGLANGSLRIPTALSVIRLVKCVPISTNALLISLATKRRLRISSLPKQNAPISRPK